MNVRIDSQMPAPECLRRIGESFVWTQEHFFFRVGPERVITRVAGDTVWATLIGLRETTMGSIRRSRSPVFIGRVLQTASGSALVGSIEEHRTTYQAVRVLSVTALALVIPIAVVAFMLTGFEARALFYPGFVGIGGAVVGVWGWVEQRLDERDTQFLVAKLASAIDGVIAINATF